MDSVIHKGIVICGALLASAGVAWAGECAQPVGRLVSLQGEVDVRVAGQGAWHTAQLNEKYCPGDALRTGPRARAAVELSNETIVRLDQRTTLTLTGLEEKTSFWVDLLNGAAHFLSRTPRALKVKTPYVNAGVEGTEFVVRAENGEGSVSVVEGRVLAENQQGAVPLTGGQAAVARNGQAPVAQTVVHLRDAVQWSLYYPPVFDAGVLTGDAAWLVAARQSAMAAVAGRMNDAIAAVAATPEVNDARFFNHRAGLLLSVGRVDEAQVDITRSRALAPDNAHATALQSITALARGDSATALTLAQRATEKDPASVPAWIALSYAQQATFNIESARTSVERAQQLSPDNVLVAARLAELLLSQGDLRRALTVAQRAVALNPDSTRTHTVLGFAHLTRIKTGEAKQAFEKAIAIDSADPLPRLGLGLAIIRSGKLEDGRREIEIAAALDPNNALIRSYLGKAYYEEKRNKLAAVQFDMARQLDPNDPTPWYYDAIRKQTENRPVEALDDLQKSIALNDNRAVYRSRLLLDQDLAARSASLARIYSDIGFQQLALLEGWKSVNTDPSNYSAHRFLADSYAGLPRHEIGRVSELLQAQLLQPLNLQPLQPRLSDSQFTALESAGPAQAGANEFNPLFLRDGYALQADMLAGSHGTLGDELALSGLYGPVSWSVGQSYYYTDGYRANGAYEQKLYNLFGQVALSPFTSMQVEIRSDEVEHGDVAQRLNPVTYPNNQYKRSAGTARLGYHQELQPGSDVLASVIFRHGTERQHLEEWLDPFTLQSSDVGYGPEGYLAEVQHLWRRPSYNITSGLGYYQENSGIHFDVVWEILGTPIPIANFTVPTDTRQSNAYVYGQFAPSRNTLWTLGLSYDNYQEEAFDKSQFNPKLGLIWNPLPDTTLRFAAFRTMKRALHSDQTLEPTQIAGFAQFFDDLNATDAKRYGAALDQRFSSRLWGGVELSHRDLELITDTLVGLVEDARENMGRLYLYWAINPRWSLGAEYFLEGYERERIPATLTQPKELTTHRLPLTLSYFHPAGWFGGLKVSPFVQRARLSDGAGIAYPDEDRFWLTDLTLGYRLPARRGLASLTVRNLFDREFRYQDVNFQTNEPRFSPYQPERAILARLSLAF